MSGLLACLCCCCFEEEQTPPPQRPRNHKKKKKTQPAKLTRLKTKYKPEQFVLVDEEERREKKVKAYCCPICTLYYTKILACSECINFICLKCFEGYDKKTVENKQILKCPFCSSEKSFFVDHELDPHSYFDTTGKGFLSKQDRIKMDVQLGSNVAVNQVVPQQRIEEHDENQQEQRQQ